MHFCYVCPLSKQRRLYFDLNNHVFESPFDLIHCDVWGPYHVPDSKGQRYFLTIVDNSTRFTWLYLMKHKYDVQKIIPYFFTMTLTQLNAKIKTFHSDNAKELAFTDFFNKHGVLHQFSCVERTK